MASGAAVQGLGQDRQPRRDTKNLQMVAGLLDDGFGAAGFWRWQENSIRSAGNIFFRPKDSDVGLDSVVVRRDVVVAYGPVIAHAIVRAHFEIHGSHAQDDAPPVVGAPADNARTEPAEL